MAGGEHMPLDKEFLAYRRLLEVLDERRAQHLKWGEQNHPDGTGSEKYKQMATLAREACDEAFKQGLGTYRHILLEEVFEAMAEADKAALRKELVQVAAVATAWVEKLDREAQRAAENTHA